MDEEEHSNVQLASILVYSLYMWPRIISPCSWCSTWQIISLTGCVMYRLLVRWWILMWRVFVTWNCWPGSSFSATIRQRRLPPAWESLLMTSCGSRGVRPPVEPYASAIPPSCSSPFPSHFPLPSIFPSHFSPLFFFPSISLPSLLFPPLISLPSLPAPPKVTRGAGGALWAPAAKALLA